MYFWSDSPNFGPVTICDVFLCFEEFGRKFVRCCLMSNWPSSTGEKAKRTNGPIFTGPTPHRKKLPSHTLESKDCSKSWVTLAQFLSTLTILIFSQKAPNHQNQVPKMNCHASTNDDRRVSYSLVREFSELHCRGRCRFNSCPRPIRVTW